MEVRDRLTRIGRGLAVAAALLATAPARGATNDTEPHLGFVYPAGGRQGTTVRVVVGGQRLRGADRVHVSGRGVRGSIVGFPDGGRPFKPEQLQELGRWLKELAQGKKSERPESIPAHPLLEHLESPTPRELKKLRDTFFDPARRLQASPQIADRVEVELVIDPDAPLGERELRLGTRAGLTDPVLFHVGWLPEVAEAEIDDFTPMTLPEGPLVLNGQVQAHDVDRFRFAAKRGQRLVVDVQARRLVPYLADAVPGWFQATVTLRDARGREVAFADDASFEPDPVLLHEVREDGTYELEVRDALYRGRDDFVYRITLGEVPHVTGLFPLGGRAGVKTTARVQGWNLPSETIELDTRPEGGRVREVAGRALGWPGRPLVHAVDDLPEVGEGEDAVARLSLPCIVNGRIDPPGDVDVFELEGRAGDEVVAEVTARRLGSPLDSWLTLTDATGRVLAENDDAEDPAAGRVTHHADSYLRFRLPATGTYRLRLSDTRGHGGFDHGYRLRVGPPRPDFTLLVTPSSPNVVAGSLDTLTVHALRRDGFTGDIALALRGAPAGFALQGGLVPAGRDSVRVTLAAPRERLDRPVALALEGRAAIGSATVARLAVPADGRLQAFLNRHLVPARELLVSVSRARPSVPWVEREGVEPVHLHDGSTAEVRFRAPRLPSLDGVRFELDDGPPGVTIAEVRAERGGLTITLRAEAGAVKAGTRDNLIVDVFGEPAARPGRRTYLGSLPAVPLAIEPP